MEIITEKVKDLEHRILASIDESLKSLTDKLHDVAVDLDEKLEIIKIQYIKTKRNESDY